MKWNNVSASKLPAYRRMLDAFFHNPAHIPKPLDYHCLFFDTNRTDDET